MSRSHVLNIQSLASMSAAAAADLRDTILMDLEACGATVLRGVDSSTAGPIIEFANLLGSTVLGIDVELSGPPVMDLRFDPAKARTALRQAYFTKDHFSLHTDLSYVPNPPRFLLTHCVRPDVAGGGVSLVSDCSTAFDKLSDADRSSLSAEAFVFPYPPNCPLGESATYSIYSTAGGERWRYRLDSIKCPQDALGALEHFDQELNRNAEAILLTAHDLLIVDNLRAVHGRTAFEPIAGTNERHLRRSYAQERANA